MTPARFLEQGELDFARGPAINRRARKKRLHSLPYNILYVIHEDEILVLGIVHHRRGSCEIRRRLRAIRGLK